MFMRYDGTPNCIRCHLEQLYLLLLALYSMEISSSENGGMMQFGLVGRNLINERYYTGIVEQQLASSKCMGSFSFRININWKRSTTPSSRRPRCLRGMRENLMISNSVVVVYRDRLGTKAGAQSPNEKKFVVVILLVIVHVRWQWRQCLSSQIDLPSLGIV